MDVWCVANEKGGARKTTLALHLAMAAFEVGHAASLIDLDPQKSALRWASRREALTGEIEPVVVHATDDSLKNTIAAAQRNNDDLVVIDTPRVIDRAMLFAVAQADLTIVPTLTRIFDRLALEDTLNMLEMVKSLHKAVVVVDEVGADKATLEDVERLANKFSVPLIITSIPENDDIVRAIEAGRSVMEAAPKSAAASEMRAVYRMLVEHCKTVQPVEERR